MECKFCNSKNINKIKRIKSPYFDILYSLYECLECKSRFFDFKEHSIDLNEFYQSISIENEDLYNIELKKKDYWERQKNRIIKLLGKYPESVLDVDCRTGGFLMHFDSNILRVGVELSSVYANVGIKRGLNIYNDFLENIEFKRKYDIVSCYAIIEHLINPMDFLRKLNELVNSNGILVIMIPTYECLKENILFRINYRWHMYSLPVHLNFYSRKFLDLFKEGFVLKDRYFTLGGMFNPFKNLLILNKIFGKMMNYIKIILIF